MKQRNKRQRNKYANTYSGEQILRIEEGKRVCYARSEQ